MTPEQLTEIRQRYQRVCVSTVADILDRKGYPNQAVANEIVPLGGPDTSLAGFAYTLLGEMVPWEGDNDPVKIGALDRVERDSVTVWSCGAMRGVCAFGDLLASGMQQRGCQGAVIDGGVRDCATILQMGFTVFSRYRTPVQSNNRWRVTASQVPVPMSGAFGGVVMVRPGDLVLGDYDGVLIVPRELMVSVLEEAEALQRMEQEARSDLGSGGNLSGALDKYGRL